jgi:hypothetical protein
MRGYNNPAYVSPTGFAYGILHEDNYSKLIGDYYLKSSGGTINGGGNSDVLTLNADSNCYMYFKVKGNTKAAVGYYNNFTFLSSEIANGARLGITDDGTPEFRTASNTHTLIHSGNIGSQSVASANKLISGTTNTLTASGVTLVDANGYQIYETGSTWFAFGSTSAVGVYQGGSSVQLKTTKGYDTTTAVFVNNSGNVTIGASDLASTSYKLYVNGGIYVGKNNEGIYIARYGNTIDSFSPSGDSLALNINHTSQGNIIMANGGGKVIIGTMADNSKGKLQVKGDLYVDGNIIATKEVSAGGAGAEGGTSGSGSAEGVSEIFTPTSTSMVFNHNLGEDVIVQVYEKNNSVWNLVMVDVEITSATRVTLRFGKTETTQHKVVIMGV